MKHCRVVGRPGRFSDKVESNLGLWLSVDFTLDHALCMTVNLITLNMDHKFKVLIRGTSNREVNQ